MTSRFNLIVLLGFLISQGYALFAIPGSPCHDACKGDTPPSSTDIVCTDGDFNNTNQGQTLQSCLNCLQYSTYAQDYRTDQFLFFYYLILIQKTCLAEPEAVPLSYCSTKCDIVSDALSESLNQTWFQTPYEYCSRNSDEYTTNAPNCGTCLQAQEGSVIVGNFVVIGNIACGSKPELWNSQNVTFDGNIFDSSTLDATAVGTNTPISTAVATKTGKSGKPTASISAAATSQNSSPPTSSSSPAAPTAQSSNSNSGSQSSGINRGAAAGIGIFAGLAGIAGVIGFAIFARKRRQEVLKQSGRMSTSPRKPTMATRGVEKPLPALKGKSNRWTTTGMTPRTSAWYWAANPKSSTDLSALPQKDWR